MFTPPRTFRLITLLLVVAAIAFVLGMYRQGYDLARRQQQRREVTTVTYEVHDLVTIGDASAAHIRAQLNGLERMVRENIAPGTWTDRQATTATDAAAPRGMITPFYDQRALVIAHNAAVHARVRELLNELRAANERSK